MSLGKLIESVAKDTDNSFHHSNEEIAKKAIVRENKLEGAEEEIISAEEIKREGEDEEFLEERKQKLKESNDNIDKLIYKQLYALVKGGGSGPGFPARILSKALREGARSLSNFEAQTLYESLAEVDEAGEAYYKEYRAVLDDLISDLRGRVSDDMHVEDEVVESKK
jgi:3-oxoacyl-ACP reductase-like protein